MGEAGRHVEASRRVESITRAAEQAATEIRDDAERRADARIAEATRAADLRVAAAEAEASELLARARAEAAEVQRSAEARAERQLGRARELANEVAQDGEAVSAQLRQLSDSLRRNAELLLRDVAAAHRVMTAKLEAADGDVPAFVSRTPR